MNNMPPNNSNEYANSSSENRRTINIRINKGSKDKLQDIQNMHYFINFNTKKDPSYRLKHYLYFGEDAKQNFEINVYNKFYRNLFHPPDLKYYLRYYNQKYDFEMKNFDKENQNKNRFYSLYYENWEEANHDKEIISTQEYKGFYSKQNDYQFFKIQLSQEM